MHRNFGSNNQTSSAYTISESALGTNPEAQAIAEAIAAFQDNNKIRLNFDRAIKTSQIIPCITMLGTYLTFYLSNITQELAEAVRNGDASSKYSNAT